MKLELAEKRKANKEKLSLFEKTYWGGLTLLDFERWINKWMIDWWIDRLEQGSDRDTYIGIQVYRVQRTDRHWNRTKSFSIFNLWHLTPSYYPLHPHISLFSTPSPLNSFINHKAISTFPTRDSIPFLPQLLPLSSLLSLTSSLPHLPPFSTIPSLPHLSSL